MLKAKHFHSNVCINKKFEENQLIVFVDVFMEKKKEQNEIEKDFINYNTVIKCYKKLPQVIKIIIITFCILCSLFFV